MTCYLSEQKLTVCSFSSSGTLQRAARPDKGKCCDKYSCSQDFDAFCANVTAKQPCITVCPTCHTTVVEMEADPSAGRCCPIISCEFDAQTCCDIRDNQNCPTPSCSPLEDVVTLETATPASYDCCPQLACRPNAERVCAAKREEDPLGPDQTACASCEIAVVTRPYNAARGECWDRFECVPDPTNLCCNFDNSTCASEPECGPFADLVVTEPIDVLTGQCCERFACMDNYTKICDAFVCEYPTAESYMAARCPNPAGRNWYFVEVSRPMSIEEGRCCDRYKCKETVEKQLYDAQRDTRRRRRRRTSA